MINSENSREKHLEATLEKLVGLSELILQTTPHDIDHQEIANAFKDISGARYVAFNRYNEAGTHFSTMAVAGLTRYHDKIRSMLGFELSGKTWPHDPVRHEKIKGQVLTRFESLADLVGDVIPAFIISRIQRLFSLGEVFLMRMMKGEQLIGDFTFVMPKDRPFTERWATEIFSRQIELLLVQRQAERKLLLQSEVLRHALEHQRILSDMAIGLNTLVDFDQRINNCLQIIGTHTGVSRVYIFENSADGQHTSNTYEWCNAGIEPGKDRLQHLPLASIPDIDRAMREEGIMHVQDAGGVDQGSRAMMGAHHTRSMLVIALYIKEQYVGFMGFDQCDRVHRWDQSEVEMLRAASGIISHAYERRLMERALEEERDRAKRASQAKSEFLANMSHEIRTPMNAILGFSETLSHRISEPESKKMVSSVLTSGKLLLSLINDILDLSKIEAGKLELLIQPVSPAAILQETHLLFSEKARHKNLRFGLAIAGGMPSLLDMDETRVKQIIFNLVSNAIKFTHEGHIRLRASFEAVHADRGSLTIEVEDTGIGIPEDLAGHIFEDFNQLSAENTRRYEGTGLGLSICKRLTEKMNGRISVRSTPGKGSLFTVVLPDLPISKRQPGYTADGIYRPLVFSHSHVLVVDDVMADIELMESLLIGLGLETSHALGGRQALEMLGERKPDLILLDTRMPDMNGYAFLQTIKDDPATNDIPVVAYSATIPGYKSNPLSKLFSGHIQKPVRRHVLVAELTRHLPYSETGEEQEETRDEKRRFQLQANELPANISEVATELESTFLPQWKKLKDQLVIFRIERFADELQAFAADQQFLALEQYAKKLSHESNTLDIESLRETMALFPYICKEIKKHVQPTT